MFKIFLLLFTMNFSWSWGKKKKLPCWVMSPCEPYKQDVWLLGVGSGNTPQEADDFARATLSKNFKVKIEQNQESFKSLQKSASNQDGTRKTTVEKYQRIRSNIKSSSSMEISGVQIVSRFEKENRFYSLAAKKRGTWLASIDKEIGEMQAQLTASSNKIAAMKDKAKVLQIYNKLIPIAMKAEELNLKRKVIAFDGAGYQKIISSASLVGKMDKVLRSIVISTNFQKKGMSSKVSSEIAKSLTLSGFNVQSKASGKSDLQLDAVMTTETPPPDKFGFIRVNHRLTVTVKSSSSTSEVLFNKDFSGSASSQDKDKAIRISEVSLIQQLNESKGIGETLTKILVSNKRTKE